MVLRLQRHSQQQRQQKQQLLMLRRQPWRLTTWRNHELSSSLCQAVRSSQQMQRHQQKMQLSLRGTQALPRLPAGGEGRRGVRSKHLHGQQAVHDVVLFHGTEGSLEPPFACHLKFVLWVSCLVFIARGLMQVAQERSERRHRGRGGR